MLKYGLLGLLNYKDMSGYELTGTFKDSIGFFWTVTMSQVYRELNSMLKIGWLECSDVLQTGKPNKKVYSITSAGKDELFRWLNEYNGDSFFITRNSFLVNLFFSAMKSVPENIRLLKKFREDYIAYGQSLAKTEETIPEYADNVDDNICAVYWDIVADYGRSQAEETIKWIDRSIKRLEELE